MSAQTVPIDKTAERQSSNTPRSWKGYIPVPRSALDSLAPHTGRLNGLIQFWIVMEVLNATWGGRERPEYAPIPKERFQRLCSAGESTRHIERCLADLEKRSIIASLTPEQAKEKGLPVADSRTKWYACCVEQWETAPKWEPRAVPPPVDREPEASAMPRAAGVTSLILPRGKRSCRQFAFPKPQAEISFRNESESSLQLDPVEGERGTEFVIRDAVVEESVPDSVTQPAAPRKGAQSEVDTPHEGKFETPALRDLREMIDGKLLGRLGTIDNVMLHRSAEALGLSAASAEEARGLIGQLAREVDRAASRMAKHALIALSLAPKAREDYRRNQEAAPAKAGETEEERKFRENVERKRRFLDGH